ncbi:MAG: LTA synthase family protein [Bacillota bacterium]|jgi:phosphoglycerol transferase MdoB-like AlkP superfamily enzyme
MKFKELIGKIKAFREKKAISMNLPWMIVALILSAGFILITTMCIQPGPFVKALTLALQNPLVLFLNFLPIVLLLAFVTFLYRNVFCAAAIVGTFFNVISYINNLKTVIRTDPLVPRDISLLGEAFNAAGTYNIEVNMVMIGIIIFTLVLFNVLAFFIKSPNRKYKWRTNIICAIICAVALVLSINTFYTPKFVYTLKTSQHTEYLKNWIKKNNMPKMYEKLGFTFCFCYQFNTYPIDKPETYSAANVKRWINEFTPEKEPEVKPHVIVVMNEAFSDISEYDVFNYSAEDDPLKNFKAIAADPHTISGHIIVSSYGAGTANTEFDFITGMQSNMISETSASSFRIIRKKMDNLVRLYKGLGYQTKYMHPGEHWFYNRDSVYNFLGIEDEDKTFVSDFPKSDHKGGHVSDEAFGQRLISHFEEAKAKDSESPLFEFGVTIQNHLSYPADKYGDDVEIQKVPLNKEISNDAMDILSVYMYGLKDADELLKDLTNYFEEIDEPVVLVYFGDHLPALGADKFVYEELGLPVFSEETPEDAFKNYKTPYLIWTNGKAISDLDMFKRIKELNLPADGDISVNYLSAILTDLTDASGQDAYFSFLNEARTELPVIWRKSFYKDSDGNYLTSLSDEQAEIVNKMRQWQYYKITEEKIVDK